MTLSRRRLLAAAAALPAVPARAQPQRVLALGGAVTETVFALGRGGDLVGVDLTSNYPAAAGRLPKVGYLRALGAEGMLSLSPTLVLASADAGPPAAMDQVRAARVPVVTLPEAHSPETALERVKLVGAAMGETEAATTMGAAMRADLAQLAEDLGRVTRRPRVLFLLSAGRGAPMAAGTATAAEGILALAEAENAISGYSGYKPLSGEAALLLGAEAVLTTSETLEGVGGPAGLRAGLPGMDPALPVIAFDGLFLLGFGPRLAQAAREPGGGAAPGNGGPSAAGTAMGGVTSAPAQTVSVPGDRRTWVLTACALAAALCFCLCVSLLVGAVRIPPARLLALLLGAVPDAREAAVLWQIRMPRAALAIAVGAALGLAGAAQQGLFRNPLADPALVGVSAGAALGAVATIVLGGKVMLAVGAFVPARAVLPVTAFAGGVAATLLVLRLARAAGGGTAGLLLAGIAVNAVAGAATGLLVTSSDDRQLRDITFWSLGSLASGGWVGAVSAALCALAAGALLLPAARKLDALLLGESEAEGLGVDVDRLRLLVVCAVALAVAGAVAAAGVIGFLGLVVPHLVRMSIGPRHGMVLPTAAVGGACLLLLADAMARWVAAPAELPVGLVTSLLGGPFFVMLLLRARAG